MPSKRAVHQTMYVQQGGITEAGLCRLVLPDRSRHMSSASAVSSLAVRLQSRAGARSTISRKIAAQASHNIAVQISILSSPGASFVRVLPTAFFVAARNSAQHRPCHIMTEI